MNTQNIFKTLMLSFAVMLMTIVSCTKGPENGGDRGEPAFPELAGDYIKVAPGETIAPIVFTPNYDWEISLPIEARQWFWMKDGSRSVRRITGKASAKSVTIFVCVTEYDDFDSNHSCEVTLTMAGQSKVVGKYQLPAKEKSISVYSAQWDADGVLIKNDAEDSYLYKYGKADITDLAFNWSAEDADFRAPIKVNANCTWDVVKPDWMDINVPESSTGVYEIVITGESLLETSGKLVFTSGDQILKEINVNIPSCNDISIYAAKVDEYGELEYAENGYVYNEEPSSDVDMLWLGSDFRIPVKVDSKCTWTLVCPDWVTYEMPEKTTGENVITFIGDPTKYPLEQTTGKLVFMKDETVLRELNITIPGCKDILYYDLAMSMTSLEFSYDGLVKTSVGFEELTMTGNVMSTKDARIFAVETTGDVLGSVNPDWFTITLSSWNNADGANVLQDRTMSFSVTENEGDERKAMMFVLPATITVEVEELFNSDMTVKEEYAQWAVPVVQLSMNYSDYITIEEAEEPDFTFERASDEKAAELTALFGNTDFVYVLTYEDMYASDQASMTMAVPFSEYRVYSQDNSDMTADATFWLQYTNYAENNNYGVIKMYLDMELPETASVGHLVFYNSMGEVLAIVECVSPVKEEIVVPPADEDIEGLIIDEYGNKYVEDNSYFNNKAQAANAGAKMYQCIAGSYYDQYREFGCPVYILEYTSKDSEIEIKLPSTVQYWSVMPYEYRSYITLNGDSNDITLGIMSKATDRVKLKMAENISTQKEEIETKHGGIKVTLHKDMSAQDPTFVVFCRLNLE